MSTEDNTTPLDRLVAIEAAIESHSGRINYLENANSALGMGLNNTQEALIHLDEKLKATPPNQESTYLILEDEQAKLVRAQRHQVEAETSLIEERIKAVVHKEADSEQDRLWLREKKAEIAVLVGKTAMWIGLAVLFVTLAFKVN